MKRKDDGSDSVSVGAVIEALQALPDMDQDLILDACDFFRNPQKGEIFMALDPKLRKRWLTRNLSRSGQPSHQMQILVEMSGKRICLEVVEADTIAVVKAKIEAKEGISPGKHWLTYGGCHLDDDKTLGEYKVSSGSTLHMVLRLCGC